MLVRLRRRCTKSYRRWIRARPLASSTRSWIRRRSSRTTRNRNVRATSSSPSTTTTTRADRSLKNTARTTKSWTPRCRAPSTAFWICSAAIRPPTKLFVAFFPRSRRWWTCFWSLSRSEWKTGLASNRTTKIHSMGTRRWYLKDMRKAWAAFEFAFSKFTLFEKEISCNLYVENSIPLEAVACVDFGTHLKYFWSARECLVDNCYQKLLNHQNEFDYNRWSIKIMSCTNTK